MDHIVTLNSKNYILYYEYFLSQYRTYLELENKADETVKVYINCITEFLTLLKVDVNDIDYTHILDYRNELQDVHKLAPSTINKKIYAIKSFLSWLCDNDYIDVDIARKIRTIKIKSTKVSPKSLTNKEIKLILHFCELSPPHVRLRNLAMIQLMINTGIRVSELVELNCEDVNIKKRYSNIEVKNCKGLNDREIRISTTTRDALVSYFKFRLENDDLKNENPAIACQDGERMSIRVVQATIQNLARKAKITRLKVSPHTLRHTFATRYHKETKDLAGLAAICGHNSINSTAKYSLPSEDKLLQDLDWL